MKKNESHIDRIIRIVLGVITAVAAFYTQMQWLYVVAAILLITGATGFCGLYALFGISTCHLKKK